MTEQSILTHHLEVDGRYIEVRDRGALRWLEFGDGIVQTIIDRDNPGHLPSAVNRAMLACLAFIDTPRHVALLGTGGGAIARYLQFVEPTIRGTAIEYSIEVADIAKKYFEFPNQNSHWQLKVDDVRHYFQHSDEQFSMMVLDIARDRYQPPWVADPAFLNLCHQHLEAQGVLVINMLCRDADHFSRSLWTVRQIFESHTVCLSVPNHSNVVVFAFKDIPPHHDSVSLNARVAELEPHWQLGLPEWLRKMAADNPVGSGIF